MRRLEIQFKFPLVTWRRGRNYQRVGKRVGWILERVESIVSSFEYTSKYGVDQAEFTFFRFWIIALLGHYHPLIEKLLFFIPTKIKNERPFLFSWKNSSFISVELINRLPHSHTFTLQTNFRRTDNVHASAKFVSTERGDSIWIRITLGLPRRRKKGMGMVRPRVKKRKCEGRARILKIPRHPLDAGT